MWELDCEEGWVPKNWYSWTVVLEKTLEGPLDCKEIQPVHPKRDQSWVFIGRTDVEAETQILWPPDVKSWLIWKDPDAGKDWGQEEKGTTEDEMGRWHHRLNEHGFGWTPGVGDGQEGLVCCGSWGRKESDTAERLNWTELNWNFGGLSSMCFSILEPKLKETCCSPGARINEARGPQPSHTSHEVSAQMWKMNVLSYTISWSMPYYQVWSQWLDKQDERKEKQIMYRTNNYRLRISIKTVVRLLGLSGIQLHCYKK